MPLFWFFTGVMTAFAVVVVSLPWLRKMPRYASLPVLPWQASVGALVLVAAILGLYPWLRGPAVSARTAAPAPARAADSGGAFGSAVKAFADSSKESDPTSASANAANPAAKPAAGSMNMAISSLESRLAKGGGSDGDWELLAKSFEFLGRPADAAKARARQLPPVPADADAPADEPAVAPKASAAPLASRSAVSGEISLAPELKGKAAAGETLFIVAKSVDSPGVPVAVFRGSVGSWPLKFTLDDSQSMLPGRNLSSAGRVTIEARISQKGQPLPSSGDLQGSTGVINPADHPSLKILIDRIIT
jgi:hypothetical protein